MPVKDDIDLVNNSWIFFLLASQNLIRHDEVSHNYLTV